MNKVIRLKHIVLALVILAIPALSNAASLLEVYQQALQSDPLIHEAEARRLAALEAQPQARSALFPQINASGSWQQGNFEGTDVIELGPPLGDVTNQQESIRETTAWNVGLRQTLFRWDQIVGLKQAGKIVSRAEADREAAQQDLIIRVARRYFEVLGAEDRLTSIHADRLAIARQLEQAKQRFDVGLIAITDVQESQAAYDQSVAAEIQAKRELATSRNFLREITGEYVSTLSAPGENFHCRTRILPTNRAGSSSPWDRTWRLFRVVSMNRSRDTRSPFGVPADIRRLILLRATAIRKPLYRVGY